MKRLKYVCLECGKHFEAREPVCPAPRCKSADVEPDFERYYPNEVLHGLRIEGLR